MVLKLKLRKTTFHVSGLENGIRLQSDDGHRRSVCGFCVGSWHLVLRNQDEAWIWPTTLIECE